MENREEIRKNHVKDVRFLIVMLVVLGIAVLAYVLGDILLKYVAMRTTSVNLVSVLEGARRLSLMFGCLVIACFIERLNLAPATPWKTTMEYTARDWFILALLTFNIIFSGVDASVPHMLINAAIIIIAGQITIYSRSEEDGSRVFGYLASIAGVAAIWIYNVIVPISKSFETAKSLQMNLGTASNGLALSPASLLRSLAKYSSPASFATPSISPDAVRDAVLGIIIRFVVPTFIMLAFLLYIRKNSNDLSDDMYASKYAKKEKKDLYNR